MLKHLAHTTLQTVALARLGHAPRNLTIAGLLGLSMVQTQECPPGADDDTPTPASEVQLSPVLFDAQDQPVNGVASSQGGTEAQKAALQAETATIYFSVYDCALEDAREAPVTETIENFMMNESGQEVAVWFESAGSQCMSVRVETSTGELYVTKDLLENVDGDLAYPDEAHAEVELAYDTAFDLGELPMWEQLDWDEIDSIPEFNHTVIVKLDQFAVSNLSQLQDAYYKMWITGCVSTSAGGRIDLDETEDLLVSQTLTGTATDHHTYLIPGEDCVLNLEGYEADTSGALMLRVHGDADFDAPVSDWNCPVPGECNVEPTYIEDIELFWNDAQVQAILVKEGNLLNLQIHLDDAMMAYLHEFDASDLSYDIYMDGPGTDDHKAPMTLETTVDQGKTQYWLDGWVTPVQDVDYRTTVSVYLKGDVLMWAVADVNLAGVPPTSLEFIYAITLVSQAASRVPYYAYATTDSAFPVSMGVLVEASCDGEKITCLTGAATLPNGDLSSHSGAYVCQLDLPYLSECSIRYSYPGYQPATVGPLSINSLTSQNLPTVWLTK